MNVIDQAASILNEAIKAKVSDIHLEPFASLVHLRFRKDGKLFLKEEFALTEAGTLAMRFKVMAAMDIANNRIPQDGKMKYRYEDRTVDLRFSTLPTLFGEKISIRILDQATGLLSLANLKIPMVVEQSLLAALAQNHGLFLVVGPTGSGKTTTLYAILQYLNSLEKNIITIEDPVEYQLKGINQVQVNTKAGLTFASGLRAILRQDPDIILVGEIRDLETAEISLRAALTGHLVLGTLHTRDSIEAIVRLQDMGIPSFRISSALRGVVAQRLIPTYCPRCRGEGCPECNSSGFSGRQAVFEYLAVTTKIQETINKNLGYNQLQASALLEDWRPFRENMTGLLRKKVASREALKEFLL